MSKAEDPHAILTRPPMGFKMWPLGVISDLDFVLSDLPLLRQSAEMGEKP